MKTNAVIILSILAMFSANQTLMAQQTTSNIIPILQLLLFDDDPPPQPPKPPVPPKPIVCTGPNADFTTDTDEDSIADCHEINGTYGYITDHNNADTDGDGLDDRVELLPSTPLDLLQYGVNPLHKDVLIEIDWFDDAADFCGAHTHRPVAATINTLIDIFNQSPVSNPDGTTGITLIIDYGQGGIFTGGNFIADDDGELNDGMDGTDYQQYKTDNFSATKHNYFHYFLQVHRFKYRSTVIGRTNTPNDTSIISMFCHQLDLDWYPRVLMHELGHQFNLKHGGDTDCNDKPNYNSIMNSRYSRDGTDLNCDGQPDGGLSYSTGPNSPIDENSINEFSGICGSPVDFNEDGAFSSALKFDLNSGESSQGARCVTQYTVLTDYDDWNNLNFTITH